MTAQRIPAGLAISLINIYRNSLSIIMLPSCRFEPSCSVYAEESIRRHGLFRGMAWAMSRLLRCHPGSSGGFDPVQ